MADIEIRGLAELYAKLETIEDIQDVLEAPMKRAMYRLQNKIATYPRPPGGSTYVRTGNLGRSWTTRVTRTTRGVRGRIGSDTRRVPYGPWVQSSKFQAKVHRGRWKTDQDVVDDQKNEIQRDFDRAVQQELDK